MDFNQLMAKMRELDAPVQAAPQAAVQECGDPMGMPNTMPPSMNDQPPPAHPSMTVNLNAQGMDSIESLLKLMTKVNPDMINQPAPMPAPALSVPPSIMSIKPPMPGIGDLGNLDAGPLKMLPDLDKDEPHDEPDADNMGGPSDNDSDNMPPMGDLDSDDKGIDAIQKSMGDNDGDGDHDMDDHDMEKDDEEKKKEKEEGWGNGLTGHDDVDYKGMDAAMPSGNDLNKPKSTFPKVAGGDNPMQRNRMESKEELRASIRAELLSRLNETKVTELSKDTLKSYQDKAGKEIVHTMTSGDHMTTDKSAKKVMNRMKGSEKADNKIWKKDNA
jgi:hypothetical protein